MSDCENVYEKRGPTTTNSRAKYIFSDNKGKSIILVSEDLWFRNSSRFSKNRNINPLIQVKHQISSPSQRRVTEISYQRTKLKEMKKFKVINMLSIIVNVSEIDEILKFLVESWIVNTVQTKILLRRLRLLFRGNIFLIL